jgi:thioredoxin reductase (NADPH)
MQKKVRVVVIGSGPAGLTAALYTARGQYSTVVITGPRFGGQIATTHEVENYPGFPDGTTGPELVEAMKQQAEKFGTEFDFESVTEVDFEHGSPFRVKTYSTEYLADAVIVTIGANPRELGIPGEREYIGRGVSYCATCDGFFFRTKEILVVGGGDSALQEGIFLTKFASKVYIVHRRDELRASAALQKRALENPKIEFILSTVAEEVKADENGVVKAVTLKNLKTGEVYDKPVQGLFVFVGYDPNSGIFKDQLAKDASGYVIIDQLMRTNLEGVFAAGEIHDSIWRQAITAAGQGCSAALAAIHWLQEREGEKTLQPLDITEAVPQAGD